MGKKHRIIRKLNKITEKELPDKGGVRYFNIEVITIYIRKRWNGSLYISNTWKSDRYNGLIKWWIAKFGKGLGISD